MMLSDHKQIDDATVQKTPFTLSSRLMAGCMKSVNDDDIVRAGKVHLVEIHYAREKAEIELSHGFNDIEWPDHSESNAELAREQMKVVERRRRQRIRAINGATHG